MLTDSIKGAEMRKTDEINVRIRQVEERLRLIDRAISREIARPFFERSREICQFLDMEKKIYSSMLKELNWVLYE
jgi:hypothetical protein